MSLRADDLKPMLSGILIPVDVHIFTPEEIEVDAAEEFSFVDSILKSGKTVFRWSVLVCPIPTLESLLKNSYLLADHSCMEQLRC